MKSKCIIRSEGKIIDALRVLNELADYAMTLFVVDENDCIIGTLTDGDIRRALINDHNIESSILSVMHRTFTFIREDDPNLVARIQECRNKRIKLVPVLDKDNHIVSIYNLDKQKSMLPVDVVLMAGGKGERLRPLTEKTPKPLLKVGDKAIIDYNVERLISYGIQHIFVTVNYLREQLEEHFSQPFDSIKVECVSEPKFLGTMGSVRYVEKFYNDTVLVMNSDLFTNLDYEDFYLHFKENDADMSVASVPYSISVPYGIFDINGRNILGVLEKPTFNYYVNAGIYLIKKELLSIIPCDKFFNATDFIEMLIADKKKVVRFPITGYWLDIGKHEEYNKAQELVKHIKG